MWKSILELGMPQMTIWHMRIECWIPKSTNTNPEYVIHIVFPLQPWLYKTSSLLRWVYIASLAYFIHKFRLCVCYESRNRYIFFSNTALCDWSF